MTTAYPSFGFRMPPVPFGMYSCTGSHDHKIMTVIPVISPVDMPLPHLLHMVQDCDLMSKQYPLFLFPDFASEFKLGVIQVKGTSMRHLNSYGVYNQTPFSAGIPVSAERKQIYQSFNEARIAIDEAFDDPHSGIIALHRDQGYSHIYFLAKKSPVEGEAPVFRCSSSVSQEIVDYVTKRIYMLGKYEGHFGHRYFAYKDHLCVPFEVVGPGKPVSFETDEEFSAAKAKTIEIMEATKRS